MSDWISFADYPPIEMLMRPFTDFTKADLGSEAVEEKGQDSSLMVVTASAGGKSPEPACEVTAEVTRKEVTVAGLGSGQRSSVYRGVTRHRWTGRYEAHLWDNTCKREGQKRKGRQVRCAFGGFDFDWELPPFGYEKADGTIDTVTINHPT